MYKKNKWTKDIAITVKDKDLSPANPSCIFYCLYTKMNKINIRNMQDCPC